MNTVLTRNAVLGSMPTCAAIDIFRQVRSRKGTVV